MSALLLFRHAMMRATAAISKYIKFADPEVLRVLLENITTDDGIGLTTADVEGVTSISTWFQGNTAITEFDEFERFTGVTWLSSQANGGTVSGAFAGCTALESITLPSSVTIIGDYTFSGCTSLQKIGNLTYIQTVARGSFGGTAVEKFTFERLETIYSGVFENSLTKKVILPKVKRIENAAFSKSYNIELVLAGEGLTYIGLYSFWQMTSGQTHLICLATTPPTLASNNNLNFCANVYVPDESVADYQAATNWAGYAGKIVGISSMPTDIYNEVKDYL